MSPIVSECERAIAKVGWFGNFQTLVELQEEFVAFSNLWGAKKFLKLLLKTRKLLPGQPPW